MLLSYLSLGEKLDRVFLAGTRSSRPWALGNSYPDELRSRVRDTRPSLFSQTALYYLRMQLVGLVNSIRIRGYNAMFCQERTDQQRAVNT